MNLKKSKNSLVFFGTGQTSLEALQCLAENFDIELVVTKPPATNSAGKKFKNSVHTWAESNKIPIVLTSNKTELEAAILKAKPISKLGVVLDYSLIIPKQIIDYFEFGILNSHFSLLPKYRGPNPIRTAILNGDKLTGVTVIRITPELDDGPILTWAEITIECMNAIELREQLSNINCALLPETVKLYLNNELELISQDESQAIYTTKTTKDDGKLDPTKSAEQLEREVRAYAGWPKSYFDYRGKTYIVHRAVANSIKVPAGELRAINKKLYYGCKNGSLEILEIQPTSKPRMNAQAFINGYQI